MTTRQPTLDTQPRRIQRCDRGHFLPAGAWPGTPCAHAAYRPIPADLWGQGVPGRRLHRIATVQLAGSWL